MSATMDADQSLDAAIEPGAPVLEVTDLTKLFPLRSPLLRRITGSIRAVDDVTLSVRSGETVGLVGESGSGKSTLGRLALRLIEPSAGRVVLAGHDISNLPESKLRPLRRNGQMIFQDPYSSLDPRSTIANNVGEPLERHFDMTRKERDERVGELLDEVNLNRTLIQRYPHEFSGGQLQRIALARALSVQPQLIVADEPVSSLDVSTQAQIIGLLDEVQQEFDLALLFISHDLSVVRNISDRIAVMHLGQLVETGSAEDVTERPKHPYTAALLSAVPLPDPVVQRSRQRLVLQGDLPSPVNPPSGCRFHTRCPFAMEVCEHDDPAPHTTKDGTIVKCHLHHHGPELGGRSVLELAAPVAGPEG